MNPFEFINCISNSNTIPFTKEQIEKYYNPYITVSYFSKFEDCIFIVNEINTFKHPLSKPEHFLYLHSMIRKRKRFYKKTDKKNDIEDSIKLVQEYFEYSREKAKEAIKILTTEQLKKIKNYFKERDKTIIK